MTVKEASVLFKRSEREIRDNIAFVKGAYKEKRKWVLPDDLRLFVNKLEIQAFLVQILKYKNNQGIIISLIDMGFGYESSEEFLAALLAEDDSTAEDLYYDTNHEYHSVVYEFWDDIEYDIDDGELNTEKKVWNRIQKSMAN